MRSTGRRGRGKYCANIFRAGIFLRIRTGIHTRGITVNNIQPGPIDTDLNAAAGDWASPQTANTGLNRYGHVEEIAAMVAFVAGPDAAYITGANLTVDGGTNA